MPARRKFMRRLGTTLLARDLKVASVISLPTGDSLHAAISRATVSKWRVVSGSHGDAPLVMRPGLSGVGLLDFGSRRPLKDPCSCRGVIPKSFALRCSNWWLLAARSQGLPVQTACRLLSVAELGY